jgi:hypothetical protein
MSDTAVEPNEAPIGWACCWAVASGRPPFFQKEERIVCPTQAEATAKLVQLRALNDLAAGCVVAVYAKRANPTTKAAKRRSLEALGMPVLLSPRAAERQASRQAKRQKTKS